MPHVVLVLTLHYIVYVVYSSSRNPSQSEEWDSIVEWRPDSSQVELFTSIYYDLRQIECFPGVIAFELLRHVTSNKTQHFCMFFF